MTNAVTTTQAHKPALRAGGSLTAIVPQSIEEAYRMASAVVAAGMAPKSLDTPEKAMVAIMHGMEVGLTPMAAMQSIAVVNGFPTIWGDGALGLVRGSGLCESVREWMDGTGDEMAAVCEVKRKGEPEPITRTFSVADAKKANLWSKTGPWQQYPKRMLQMRARSLALRDGFADVLRGLRIREEVEDYQTIRDVAPQAETAGLRARLAARRDQPEEGFTVAHGTAEPEFVDVSADEVDAAPEPVSEPETPADEKPAADPADDVIARVAAALDKAWADGEIGVPEDVDAIAGRFAADINAAKAAGRARKLVAETKARLADAERGDVE